MIDPNKITLTFRKARSARELALARGGAIALMGGAKLIVTEGSELHIYRPESGVGILADEGGIINNGKIEIDLGPTDESK